MAASASVATSWPQMLPVPLVGVMNPASMRMVVDLPAPFGPEETQDFARFHAKSEVVDGQQAVVVLGQVLRLDHGA